MAGRDFLFVNVLNVTKMNFKSLKTKRKGCKTPITLSCNKIETELAIGGNDFRELAVLKIQFIGNFRNWKYVKIHLQHFLYPTKRTKSNLLNILKTMMFIDIFIKQYQTRCFLVEVKDENLNSRKVC